MHWRTLVQCLQGLLFADHISQGLLLGGIAFETWPTVSKSGSGVERFEPPGGSSM
jgi:hypothetical protein